MEPKADMAGSLFEKMFGNLQHIEDLPGEEITPEFASFRSAVIKDGNVFTEVVRGLCITPIFTRQVRDLAQLFWDLVGNRITPVVGGAKIASLHFWAEVPKPESGKKSVACIMCPPNWAEMVQKEPIMQSGAVVFIASQARDYYNERLIDGHPIVHKRAIAFEAEFLHCVIRNLPFQPNEYQQKVMQEMPKGLASLEADLWYESKNWEKP